MIDIPKELLDAVENNIQILHEAIKKEENPDRQIAYRKMASTATFDSTPQGHFQVIVELCVNPDYFLEEGDIVIITERQHDKEPYKVAPAETSMKELLEKLYVPAKFVLVAGDLPKDIHQDLRDAFLEGFEFNQWLNTVSMSHPDIPVHTKYLMFKNQRKVKGDVSMSYADVAEANSMIDRPCRYRGLTVSVGLPGNFSEYWYKDGIADGDLVLKNGGGNDHS